MKSLQDNLINLATQCAIKKIELIISPTGAIVHKDIFKGKYIYSARYEKGKVKVYEGVKIINTIDTIKPSKQENKKAGQKKSKDNKTISDVSGDAVPKVLGSD